MQELEENTRGKVRASVERVARLKELPFKLALNDYAFHWSFPEIVADRLGFFKRWGIRVEWNDVTPKVLTDKRSMYSDLLGRGLTELYHAGEWACIERVLEHADTGIVAKSTTSNGTLNSTFTVYVRSDSSAWRPADLNGQAVAVEPGTGSYYTALQDLERHIPRRGIKLVQGGEPHKRLVMLANKEIVAASLLGPWSDLAEALGMKPLIRTRRTNPTTCVVRRTHPTESLRRFFAAVNKAIETINSEPGKVRALYFERFNRVLSELPADIREAGIGLETKISVPRWNKWEPYTENDFNRTYDWMLERKLARAGAGFAEVAIFPSEKIFPLHLSPPSSERLQGKPEQSDLP